MRSGRWKPHFPHSYRSLAGTPGSGGKPGDYEERQIGLSLFDLESDSGETTSVAERHPDVVERLSRLAALPRADLGDSATGQAGKDVRAPGRL